VLRSFWGMFRVNAVIKHISFNLPTYGPSLFNP